MKKACVLLADGFEEVEAITPIDYLRRAKIEVTVVGVTGRTVAGSHGIRIDTEAQAEALALDYDCIVVPGGSRGADNLAASPAVTFLIKRHFAEKKLVAAICAAPAVVLHEACGILAGRKFTCYPGLEKRVSGASFSEDRVVQDGALITSRGAGTAGEFAKAIVRYLAGDEAAESLASSVVL